MFLPVVCLTRTKEKTLFKVDRSNPRENPPRFRPSQGYRLRAEARHFAEFEAGVSRLGITVQTFTVTAPHPYPSSCDDLVRSGNHDRTGPITRWGRCSSPGYRFGLGAGPHHASNVALRPVRLSARSCFQSSLQPRSLPIRQPLGEVAEWMRVSEGVDRARDRIGRGRLAPSRLCGILRHLAATAESLV
jgi:hypothetical protein